MAELGTFWPNNNTSAIGKYTKGGIKFTASIEDSGAEEIVVNATTTTTISPKIYVIAFDGGELIFPLTGWRKRDDYADNKAWPAIDAGRVFHLWGKDKGSAPWSASIVGINGSNNSINGSLGCPKKTYAFVRRYNFGCVVTTK